MCNERAYEILDHTLLVFSECPMLSEHIDCFLKCMETRCGGPESLVRLAVFNAPNRHVMLCSPEIPLASGVATLDEGWILFRQVLNRLLIRFKGAKDLLHASCVTHGKNRSAVIAGDGGAGKTSLLIALLQRGYAMACDDMVPISRRDAIGVSLPFGVTVDTNAFDVFPEMRTLKRDACRFLCEGQCQWTVNLADMYPVASAYEELQLTHFFFLCPDFGGKSRIEQCDDAEAMFRFLEAQVLGSGRAASSGVRAAQDREDRLALAKTLIKRARFFRVLNGGIQETADLIATACDE